MEVPSEGSCRLAIKLLKFYRFYRLVMPDPQPTNFNPNDLTEATVSKHNSATRAQVFTFKAWGATNQQITSKTGPSIVPAIAPVLTPKRRSRRYYAVLRRTKTRTPPWVMIQRKTKGASLGATSKRPPSLVRGV